VGFRAIQWFTVGFPAVNSRPLPGHLFWDRPLVCRIAGKGPGGAVMKRGVFGVILGNGGSMRVDLGDALQWKGLCDISADPGRLDISGICRWIGHTTFIL